MTNEIMTIHEALSELKVIGDRINTAINHSFIAANKHTNKKINGMSIEEFENDVTSAYQKVNDLIKRRNAIKRAVVFSNAVTKVNISGTEMSVAEAIEMNNSGIEYKELLVSQLTRQLNLCNKNVNDNNVRAENDADKFVTDTFGNKDTANAAEIEAARKSYIEAQSYELINPLNLQKEIEKLNDEISKFKTKVDSALSVSNAVTTIIIEY